MLFPPRQPIQTMEKPMISLLMTMFLACGDKEDDTGVESEKATEETSEETEDTSSESSEESEESSEEGEE